MPLMTENQRQRAIADYLDGYSTPRLARRYAVSQAAIYAILKRRGVKTRPVVKYQCQSNYFDDISKEGPAYWLGFLMADGCVTTKDGRLYSLYLALGAKDRHHINKLKEAIGSEHPINERDGGTYYWQLKDAYLLKSLNKIGCTPRKSLTLRFPKLPDGSLHHFMRGYFDGDGSIYNIGSKSPQVKICGTKAFVSKYQKHLMDNCSLRATKLWLGTNVWHLRYGGRRQVERIMRFLYRDATISLDRKRRRTESILGVGGVPFQSPCRTT